MFLLSLYLQYIKEISPQQAGFILVAQPVLMAIFSPFAGRLSDTIEPRIIASLGMAITALGLTLLICLKADSSVVFIMASLSVLGFGYALFSSPNTNAIMGSVDRMSYGLASGSVATMRLLGMMISMAIATVILILFMGRVQIMPDHYPLFIKSVRMNFMIFAVLCFFGIFSSLARGRLRGTPASLPQESRQQRIASNGVP
jgi:MFS family permease